MKERASWEDEATWPRMIAILGGMFLVFVAWPLWQGYELNPGAVGGLALGAVLAVITMAMKASRERERRQHAELQRAMSGETAPPPDEGIPEAFTRPPGGDREQ